VRDYRRGSFAIFLVMLLVALLATYVTLAPSPDFPSNPSNYPWASIWWIFPVLLFFNYHRQKRIELHEDFVRVHIRRGQNRDYRYSKLKLGPMITKLAGILPTAHQFYVFEKDSDNGRKKGFKTSFNDVTLPNLGDVRLYDWLKGKVGT
jgi:hypothetical protein